MSSSLKEVLDTTPEISFQSAQTKVHNIAQTNFIIDKKYSDLKEIGKGSYGIVCSAFDNSSGRKVAIKKITPVFRHKEEAKHVLREIRLMRHLCEHVNVITVEDFYAREEADEIYIVMELMDSDLHKVIQSKQELTDDHFRYFFHQLLCGLKYLHLNNIIHRDLKPGNLLISKNCKLCISDFGLAREKPHQLKTNNNDNDCNIEEMMTEHVVTRWYRSPELMLLPNGLYTNAIDMWSCGCILAEMILRQPLFPGKNFIHQLTLIFNLIGCPNNNDILHIKNNEANKFLNLQKNKIKKDFNTIFHNNGGTIHSIYLLENLLKFNPNDRYNVEECLNSKYMQDMDIINSNSLNFPNLDSTTFEFKYEYKNLTKIDLKNLILDEILQFKTKKYSSLYHTIRKPPPPSDLPQASSSSPSSSQVSTVSSSNLSNSNTINIIKKNMDSKTKINNSAKNIRENNQNQNIKGKDKTKAVTSSSKIDNEKYSEIKAPSRHVKANGTEAKLTKPISPKFSIMSWQHKHNADKNMSKACVAVADVVAVTRQSVAERVGRRLRGQDGARMRSSSCGKIKIQTDVPVSARVREVPMGVEERPKSISSGAKLVPTTSNGRPKGN